jgi:hypothetical protein
LKEISNVFQKKMPPPKTRAQLIPDVGGLSLSIVAPCLTKYLLSWQAAGERLSLL